MTFYDDIADNYDQITGSGDRRDRAAGFLRQLVARYPITSALDVACGTGLYAIQMAQMGIAAAGTDLSPGMLDQASRHAASAGVSVQWVQAAMQELPDKIGQTFDAVLCMGNSIPHLLTDDDLRAALCGFLSRLAPGGIVVLQLLNYARVLAGQERIVGINRDGDKQYVRFYDFLGECVRFNILEIDWAHGQAVHQLHSTTLRPYTAKSLSDALMAAGCTSVEAYCGLHFDPFDADRSETVLLIGRT